MEKDENEIEKARKAKEKRRKAKDIVRDVSVSIDPLTKLNKDLSDAAKLMTAEEARYLVDLYYQIQGIRVGTGNQITSIQPTEPTAILAWSFGSMNTIENAIRTALDNYTDGNHIGRWSKSIIGIGPVIAAGLLAHIDISKVRTVGGIWRFAGLDPTSIWSKGEKRPWNAALKTLCCLPETNISTRRGEIPIREVRVGDEVLTHQARWRKVTEVFKRYASTNIVKINAQGIGSSGPTVTSEHPIYVKQRYVDSWMQKDRLRFRGRSHQLRSTQLPDELYDSISSRLKQGHIGAHIAQDVGCSDALVSKIKHGYIRKLNTTDPITWTPADKLLPGWMVFSPTAPLDGECPVIELEKLPHLHQPVRHLRVTLNEGLARVIGLFIADGHTSKNQVNWSFGLHEEDLAAHVSTTLMQEFSIRTFIRKTNGNVLIVSCGCKQLQRWFDRTIGKLARFKKIPPSYLEMPANLVAALLRGLFEGDGCLSSYQYTTVNYQLARTIQRLLRSLRIASSIAKTMEMTSFGRGKVTIAYKVTVGSQQEFMDLVFQGDISYKSRSVAEWTKTGAWHTARSGTTGFYEGDVYNLEVEDDHSYVADGVAVHNCWKAGESFVKVSGNEKSFYGKLYVERKQFEVQHNNDGLNAEAAKKSLEEKKFSKSTDAYKAYVAGKLPDARVHLRATRWTVKIFLYFWFAEAYYHLHKKEPPMPYVIDQLKHTKLIWPDNMSFVPKNFPVQVKAVN